MFIYKYNLPSTILLYHDYAETIFFMLENYDIAKNIFGCFYQNLKILNSYKRREAFLKIKLITIIYFQTKLK